jgi:hypothetical protein
VGHRRPSRPDRRDRGASCGPRPRRRNRPCALAGEWAGELLRLGKRPLPWCYRSSRWPVWNHANRRLVRFWSAEDGTEDAVLDALRTGQLGRLDVVEPSADALAEQLRVDLAASLAHLREVTDHYWDHDWRRTQTGVDGSPEDHLWRAAMAVTEIQDALEELED